MSNTFRAWRAARLLFASALLAVLAMWAVPAASAQETRPDPPAPTQPATPPAETARPQEPATPAQPAMQGQPPAPAAPAPVAQGEPVAAPAPEPEPLFRDFRGVTLGMTAEEARGKLGTPQVSDKTQDFFDISPTQRARVYYDDQGRVSAVIVTYVGRAADAPAAKAVLGTEVEPKPDGSAYKMVMYPRAGYFVAYSRTAGDEPLTIITMQKAPSSAK